MRPHQNIREVLFSAAGRKRLAALPAARAFSGRTAMAKAVCRLFDVTDARGALRFSSGLSVLRDLETAGLLQSPPPGPQHGLTRKPRVLDCPVA